MRSHRLQLKEMERTDCENYLHSRTKTKRGLNVSQTTVANEQSTINAMMAWLYKRKETYTEGFDFKPLKRIDRGDEVVCLPESGPVFELVAAPILELRHGQESQA